METSSFGDVLGWCLAFFLPAFAMAGPLRRDRGAAQAYLFAVLLHIAAAAVYVYVPGVLPARGDAIVFHKTAVAWQWVAEWPFGLSSLLAKWYLAHIYRWVGPSFFFASILSIYAFALSVVVLVRIMELLGINNGKGLVIILFGALPTAVLYGSVPLREPYQILFFILACYALLCFRLTSNPFYLFAGIGSALLMGMLHKGLIVYAPFLITIMLLVRVDHTPQQSSSTGRVWLHRVVAVGLAVGFFAAISSATDQLGGIHGTDILSTAASDGLTDLVEEHRDEGSLTKGRTAYGVALDTSSPSRFVYSAIMIFIHYMFTPFPWQIRNYLDVYAFGEVVLRAATLFAVFRMWRRRGPVHPQLVILLMVVYVSMAFLWAAGTTNYGTATRHHMVHQWILLVLGIPALLRMVSDFLHGHPKVRGVGMPRHSAPGATHAVVANRQVKAPVETPGGPPRFRAGGCQPRRLQTLPAAPRLLSEGLGRLRRLGP